MNILEPEKHMLGAHDTDVQNDAELYKSIKMDPGPFGSELFNYLIGPKDRECCNKCAIDKK